MSQYKYLIKKPILNVFLFIGKLCKNIFNKKFDKKIKNVLVFQTGGIGDVIRIFPIIESLKKGFPDVKVSVFTEFDKGFFKAMGISNIIDEFYIFDPNFGYLKKISLIYKLHKKDFDLIISTSRGDGMIECSIMAFLIGAPFRVGFFMDGAGFLYTHKLDFCKDVPIIEQNISLLKMLDLTDCKKNISISCKTGVIKKFLPKKDDSFLIAIHPFVRNHEKERAWPLSKFIELTRRLQHLYDPYIFILGSKRESKKASEFDSVFSSNRKIKNLVGKTTISEVMAILKSSDLFIGNDSGLLHIANLFKVPSIGIFGSTSPRQVLSAEDNCIPIIKNFPCQPCYFHQPLFNHKCPYSYRCLDSISVADVIEKINLILLNLKKQK